MKPRKITLSGDDSRLFRALHSLRSPLSGEFVEHAARVSLHRILAHEQPLGDFAIAQPGCHRLENLELAGCDAELGEPRIVAREGSGDGDFLYDDGFASASEL